MSDILLTPEQIAKIAEEFGYDADVYDSEEEAKAALDRDTAVAKAQLGQVVEWLHQRCLEHFRQHRWGCPSCMEALRRGLLEKEGGE